MLFRSQVDGRRDRRHDLARAWTGDRELRPLIADVGENDIERGARALQVKLQVLEHRRTVGRRGGNEEVLGSEALRRYEEALARLSDDERELVLARIEMGMAYKDVAVATGKPSADAARLAVSRALVRLAREMEHE